MRLSEWAPIIIAIISAAAAIFAVWRQTRKDKADVATAVSDAWSKLIVPLEARVSALEAENRVLRKRERLLWNYIDDLRNKLRDANIDTGPLPNLPNMEDVRETG